MSMNIGTNICNNPSSQYSQKGLGHAKQSAKDAPKTDSKKQFKKQQDQLAT